MICLSHLWKRSLAVLAVLLVLPLVFAYASPEILPVDQITPGMKGVAKTVVSGTAIEEFDVEVLGILKDKGPAGDLILVRTSGDLIDRTGGIAEGMSGSPVYIDGKLVGAIAYGWSLTDHKIGMVTPIADMLKLWDLPDNRNKIPVDDTDWLNGTGFKKLATPLMVSGFGQPALSMLKDKLGPLNLVPYAVGDAPDGVQFGPLEPGSAVGVQLVGGDVSIGALGTVTYAEGSKVLAFGHPFLKKGNVGYLMTNAYVFTTVNGLENSFKVGTTGELIGLINQDRGAAVAGEVGRYPSVIPMLITVQDNGLNRKEVSAVQIVQDEQLAPILAAATAFNATEKAMDRVGPGTAKVTFQITGRDLPGDVLTRENMFYSPANVGEMAVGEFLDAMSLIANNQYHPVDIMDVKVNITMDEERRTAAIISAKAGEMTVKPGQKVDITVKLKPFRGVPVTQVVPFTVPKDQPEGTMMLEVRGGGLIPLSQLLLRRQGLDEDLFKPNKKKNKSFEKILKEFSQNDRNNDIVVDILDMTQEDIVEPALAATAAPAAAENKSKGTKLAATEKKANEAEDAKNKSFLTTDYIIEGDTQLAIPVMKDK